MKESVTLFATGGLLLIVTCVYYSSHSHRSSECTNVLDVASRREFLKSNRLCFNCARSGHAAAQCRSRGCGKCYSRHHTSICDRLNTTLPGNTASTLLGPSTGFMVQIDELLKNTFVDDVKSGGRQKEELLKFKEEAIKIMEEGGFHLHKWHSNIPEVEAPLSASGNALTSTVSPAYAKILGVPWNKTEDMLKIGFMKPLKEANDNKLTKRKILSAINGIFDLLGISAPVVITGKVLYSQACLRKLRCDEEVPNDIQRPWNKWLKGMAERPWLRIPRSVVNNDVRRIVLHGFADASKVAVSVAVYTLAFHVTSPVQQNLLVAKSKIAPRDLSIPRLELIAAHMLSRLMKELIMKEVLKDQPIDDYHCWVDSTTVLYWIKGMVMWWSDLYNSCVT